MFVVMVFHWSEVGIIVCDITTHLLQSLYLQTKSWKQFLDKVCKTRHPTSSL